MDHHKMLDIAIEEARTGLAEGGIPIGAALFDGKGELLGRGHNRRVQENDPSIHGETDAFRKAGRQRNYKDTIMVTTLAPVLVLQRPGRQFGIGTVIVGESVNFQGGHRVARGERRQRDRSRFAGMCRNAWPLSFELNPEVWNEDIGD